MAFPLEYLPASTYELSRTLSNEGEPAQAHWSGLSEQLCGGYDLFAFAMLAAETGNQYEPLLHALAVPRAELQAALECGKRFAARAEPRLPSYRLRFTKPTDQGADHLSVGIAVSHLESMPRTAAPFRAGGLSQPYSEERCFIGWGRARRPACRGDDRVAARLGKTDLWAHGERRPLFEFGRQKSQGTPSRLRALAEKMAAYRYLVVARDEYALSAIRRSLYVEPFPDTVTTKLTDAIKKAVKRYALGDDTELGEGEVHFIGEADSPGQAESGAHALRQYFAAVAPQFRGEQPLNAGSGTEPVEVIEFRQVEHAARRRAWRAIEVQRTDKRFEFKITLKLLEPERAVRARYVDWRRERSQAAARLVDALLANSDPTSALRGLGGNYFGAARGAEISSILRGRFRVRGSASRGASRLSFRDGELRAGAEMAPPLGHYRYEPGALGGRSAHVWLDSDGGEQELEVTESGNHISVQLRPPYSSTLCRRIGRRVPVPPPPHRTRPIVFKLPKPQRGNVYSLADFDRMGWRVQSLDGDGALLRGFDGLSRVCLKPLPCAKTGECISLKENLAVFRKALQSGQERKVSCERAEVGRCGEYRYFLFEGDIHRYEVRWFDASGKLVGQRNTTDDWAYCGGALHAYWGQVPYCTSTVVEQILCGRRGTPVSPPLRDMQSLLRSGISFDSDLAQELGDGG